MGKTKYIVITGGVLSGLGKGIAGASVGYLLSSRLKVVPIKCDGYLNVDPGTMNPIEHGEVFVLDDGGEVDMDFGHYERFLGVTCKSSWNLTMGKVFSEIRERERRGDYLGKTVQYIPHVTDLIKNNFFQIAKEEKADILLIEVGGTVGDIENELYLEAVRQLYDDVGEKNILYIHLTYIPILKGANEQKTKPTQQSVNLLRERGISPDIIIGRCKELLDSHVKEKISRFCSVSKEAVITGLDVFNVYEIPLIFEKEGISEIIHKKLGIYSPPKLSKLRRLVRQLANPSKEITVAICGKYTKLEDSYISIIEALKHCGANFSCNINLQFVETSNDDVTNSLNGVDGIIVPGGFGERGVEGKIKAISYARTHNIPYLGLCYGMQLAVIEYARNICKLSDANTTEVDKRTPHPVIDLLPEQLSVTDLGGTMRLGGYDVHIKKGSFAHSLFRSDVIRRRFRHRYEVNQVYISQLEEKGLVFSGYTEDKKIMQILELPDHPFFMGCQFHPELTSKLTEPDPMFLSFVEACISRMK
ncbi:CTP synthase (glutamine hydrolyzing) [Candidatus Woesearchaeota archaeon]|nr:CTP synthase (glutamine hydrolyzing) [Candidatus Woesearchaeota archaeon]